MWSNLANRSTPLGVAAAVTATSIITGWGRATHCDADNKLRKRKTLYQANSGSILRRLNTREELAKLRAHEQEMMKRWERDEDGWRELPARAWPAYQPNESQVRDIEVLAKNKGCFSTASSTTNECQELLFQIATGLVFYNLNAQAGLERFEQLAKDGHADSMVACGIVLVEGLGVPPREKEGIEWLKKAVALGSPQACYELGTVYYTGIDGLVEEDPVKAFQLFEQAAKSDHTAAMYMTADCLMEGEGTEKDVARAVKLFYRAAERGHRYARQSIRELLARKTYQFDSKF